ncbi:hypothetical protein BGZ83_010571, partial [Gryganskiella cystojenkinii]
MSLAFIANLNLASSTAPTSESAENALTDSLSNLTVKENTTAVEPVTPITTTKDETITPASETTTIVQEQ